MGKADEANLFSAISSETLQQILQEHEGDVDKGRIDYFEKIQPSSDHCKVWEDMKVPLDWLSQSNFRTE